jgi:hypothetical protein
MTERSIDAVSALEPSQRAALEAYSRSLVAPNVLGDFQRYIARQSLIFTESAAISTSLAKLTEALPTGVVSSLNDADLFWRSIEAEFGLLSSIEVAKLVGASANRSYASDQRKAGKLLAFQRLNKFVFPGFQFNDGSIRPVIADLKKLGRAHEMNDRDIVAWLCRPTTYLRAGDERSETSTSQASRRPVDHLDDPADVVAAATRAWDVVW